MSLEPVGKLVARHSSSPAEVQKRIDRAEAEKIIVSRMFNWIMWGMLIMGIGIVMVMVNKSFDIGRWFKLLSSCVALGGAGIAAAGVLNSMRQGVQLSGRRSPIEIAPTLEPATLTEGKTLPTNEFPDAPPSITERTTKLISRGESATDKRR